MMKRKFLEKAKKDVKQSYDRDAYLIQAVRALDDLDETKSLLFQRLDEWFKIHFPEVKLDNEESFVFLIQHIGQTDAFDLLSERVGDEKAMELKSKKQTSFGAKLEKDDEAALIAFSSSYLALHENRKKLEQYIDSLTKTVMPNATSLLGPLVAARLLSIAGSLQRLATFPASTLQVLGAEKALFKHLRRGTLPPKHGAIFQVPLVNSQPLDKRGKAARALAGKLAIALKADYYSKHDISKKLLDDLQKRLAQIDALPHRDVHPLTRDDFRDAPRRFGGGGGFRGKPSGDRPFRKPFRREGSFPRSDGPRPFRRDGGFQRREGGGSVGRPFKKPFRKPFGDRPPSSGFSDRPRGDRPQRESGGKPFRKPFKKRRNDD